MSKEILNSIVSLLFEEREQDIKNIEKSIGSFKQIFNLLLQLKKTTDISYVNDILQKDQEGRYIAIQLMKVSPKPEHDKLRLYFVEKTLQPQYMQQKTAGLSQPVDPTTGFAEIKLGYRISDYDPNISIKDTKTYNEWFKQNIVRVFKRMRSTYVHELTHILDYKRVKEQDWLETRKRVGIEKQQNIDKMRSDLEFMGMKFKRLRAPTKKVEMRKNINQLTKNIEQKTKEKHVDYINDPLELNAYFNETLSKFIFAIKKLDDRSEENIKQIVGNSPAEFADNFTRKLHSSTKKSISEENLKRYLKRVTLIYDNIIKKYSTKKEV